MPQIYAIDSHAAIIRAHCELPACPTCGKQPDLELWNAALRANAFIPTKDGAWIVSEYQCQACHRPVIKKAFLPFD